jgi:NTP pyrophosphatase (non-canonical NTP hydrolase)
MNLKNLVQVCHGIAVEKGFWDSPRNDGELLMLIVSELSEALEALRAKDIPHFEEEIADTFIRLADLCGGRDIDIEEEIRKKMRKNIKRPYRHRKAF